ncbi:uncharacterized protein LOC144155100 isoform X2 [Haemaphysalis longicornis]
MRAHAHSYWQTCTPSSGIFNSALEGTPRRRRLYASSKFLAAAWIAVLRCSALPTSYDAPVPQVPGGTTSNSQRRYSSTGLLRSAESSPAATTTAGRRHTAAATQSRAVRGADFGASYIGSPPDSQDTPFWVEMVAAKLRMLTKPSLGPEPRPHRRRRPQSTPARKRPVHVPRFATSHPAQAKPTRLTYLRNISYSTLPYYGFGYGPHGFGYGWKRYGPWGMYGAMSF